MTDNDDLYTTFAELDEDGDGRISASEFQRAMSARGEEVTSAEVASVFLHADTDKDGLIDFAEFSKAWQS